ASPRPNSPPEWAPANPPSPDLKTVTPFRAPRRSCATPRQPAASSTCGYRQPDARVARTAKLPEPSLRDNVTPGALSLRVGPGQSDDPRQRAGRERISLLRFRRQRRVRGVVGETRLHLAQETVERIDTCRHLGDLCERGAVGASRLAGGLERGTIGFAAHQWRIFFAETRQPDGVLGQRISDHRADHVALLDRIQRFEMPPAVSVIQYVLLGA